MCWWESPSRHCCPPILRRPTGPSDRCIHHWFSDGLMGRSRMQLLALWHGTSSRASESRTKTSTSSAIARRTFPPSAQLLSMPGKSPVVHGTWALAMASSGIAVQRRMRSWIRRVSTSAAMRHRLRHLCPRHQPQRTACVFSTLTGLSLESRVTSRVRPATRISWRTAFGTPLTVGAGSPSQRQLRPCRRLSATPATWVLSRLGMLEVIPHPRGHFSWKMFYAVRSSTR
mmetsp:Transcript_6118/g.8549  ORF Transcript_6118/g.8549 Transcript_6118/m.8549 type:complete len:229 (+) Transcript_6118:683-1369(+)